MSQNQTGRAPLPINTDTPLENDTPGVEAPPLGEALPLPQSMNGYRITSGGTSRLQPMAHREGSFYGGYGKQWGAGWVDRLISEQLETDAKIYQGQTILTNAVLRNRLRSVPCAPPSHPRFAEALKYVDFCDAMRRMRNGNYLTTMRQLVFDGIKSHKIAAITTRVEKSGQYKDKWVLDKLDVWPCYGYEFMADENGRFCAVRVQQPGKEARDIDPRKFLIFTFRPRNDNPYGTNIFAALCESYYKSLQANPELIALLTQYGRPGMYVIAPKAEAGVPPTQIPVFESNGDQALDVNTGLPLRLSPLQWNAIATKEYRAGTIVNLSGGSAIGLLQATPGGDALFQKLIDDTDKKKIAVLLGTDKLTESNGTLSEGNAGSSEAVMDYGILDIRRTIEEIDESLMATLLEANYGARALDLLPISDIGSTLNPRLTSHTNALVGLINSGKMTEDQYFWISTTGLLGPDFYRPGASVKTLNDIFPMSNNTQAGGNQNNPATATN